MGRGCNWAGVERRGNEGGAEKKAGGGTEDLSQTGGVSSGEGQQPVEEPLASQHGAPTLIMPVFPRPGGPEAHIVPPLRNTCFLGFTCVAGVNYVG